MAKQVHIHIHRSKARDAGEGEGKGKWITLSPSGTHVKVDGKGDITAGPKGLTGKKPSELSKGKSQSGGRPEKSAAQKFSSKLASLNRLLNQAPDGSAQAKHIQSQIRATKLQQEKANLEAKKAPSTGKPEGGTREEDRKHYLNVVRDPKNASSKQLREAIDYWHEEGTSAGHGGQEHAAAQQRIRMAVNELKARGEKVPGFESEKVAPTSPNQKFAAEMSKASKDPAKQAREWEEKASALQVKAQQEYTRNGKSDEYMRLRNEAQEAMNKGTDIMAKAAAQSKGKIEAPKPPAVSMASLKEGQALYDKSGQKVDEVESIQKRSLGKGLTINTRAGYQVHVDENGINSQGWSNEKPGTPNPSSGPDEDALRERVRIAREGMRKATNRAEEQRQEMFFEEAVSALAAMQESRKKGSPR